MADQQRILVISPHPDDESIGCGGTLHQRAQSGDLIEVLFLTSGESGGHGASPEVTGPRREQEARDAAKILGVAITTFWREPDGMLEVTARLVARLREKVREFRPHLILAPHDRDDHADHQAAARLVVEAMSSLIGEAAPGSEPEVWMYEIWTPIQKIDQIINISSSIDAKLAAIRCHKTQCDVMNFDEACRGLARYRGEMHCWPDGDYAEAFTEWQIPAPALAAARYATREES